MSDEPNPENKAQPQNAVGSTDWLDALRRIGWQVVEKGKPLPAWVKHVVLANRYVNPDGTIQRVERVVFDQPKWGWDAITGWELWFPLP